MLHRLMMKCLLRDKERREERHTQHPNPQVVSKLCSHYRGRSRLPGVEEAAVLEAVRRRKAENAKARFASTARVPTHINYVQAYTCEPL